MTIKKTLIKRVIGNDVFLIPIGKTVTESNGLFALNELGSFILDLLPKVETEAEICDAVLREYEVSAEEAAGDIAAFMNELRKLGIL